MIAIDEKAGQMLEASLGAFPTPMPPIGGLLALCALEASGCEALLSLNGYDLPKHWRMRPVCLGKRTMDGRTPAKLKTENRNM